MRGLFVGIVGAAVLAASAFGLSLDAFRAGPYDRALEPALVGVAHHASFSSGSDLPGAACPLLPCSTTWEFEARIERLPPVPYALRLEGPDGRMDLGTHEPVDGVIEVRADGEGTQPERLVLAVAGRDVGSMPLSGLESLVLSWGASADTVHVNEIGGATISGVATARLAEVPPEGWEFRARFVGPGNRTADMGALDVEGDGSVLDGRVERLRLEDYDHVVVVVAPAASGPEAGFPVLQADLWPTR